MKKAKSIMHLKVINKNKHQHIKGGKSDDKDGGGKGGKGGKGGGKGGKGGKGGGSAGGKKSSRR